MPLSPVKFISCKDKSALTCLPYLKIATKETEEGEKSEEEVRAIHEEQLDKADKLIP
jgi:hypothetical protein